MQMTAPESNVLFPFSLKTSTQIPSIFGEPAWHFTKRNAHQTCTPACIPLFKTHFGKRLRLLQAFCLPKCSKQSLETSAAASILFTKMLKTKSGNVCTCKHSVNRNAQNTVWKRLHLQAFCLPKCCAPVLFL
jgi:hypothetical protein